MVVQTLTIQSTETSSLFCPGCGAKVMGPFDEAKEYCRHVEFVYLGGGGDFAHVAPEIQGRLDAWELLAGESDEEFDPIEALKDGLEGETRFIWEWLDRGGCVGPEAVDAWVGFRMDEAGIGDDEDVRDEEARDEETRGADEDDA